MKKYAEVSESEFPLITVTFTGANADDDNFPLYLDEVKQCYSQQTKIAIIFDAEKAVFPGLKYQKMQAQWLADNTQLMTDFCIGTAYVIPNLIIRNVLKAIFAFQKQPVPFVVCSDMKSAKEWIEKKNID